MDTIWIYISAGTGPEECAHAAALTVNELLKEATAMDIQGKITEVTESCIPGNYRSVLISLTGEKVKDFCLHWNGTVQWIFKSRYRPGHKRKNWFIKVSPLFPASREKINMGNIRIKTIRSSGPGGQHVNKTESAVQIVHLPTGITAMAREERSEMMNKKLALARLAALLEKQAQTRIKAEKQERRNVHYRLERGSLTTVRIFKQATTGIQKVTVNNHKTIKGEIC